MKPKKKLLLIVVDAFSSHVLLPALHAGRLPNLNALIERGALDAQSTGVFPSITHAALSSLATGVYPYRHGIPGGYWFDTDAKQVVHYIGDFWTILNQGIGEFFKDLLVKLNQERIRATTIFEMVERSGLEAACINHLVHRGDVAHKVNIPLLGHLWTNGADVGEISGPSLLFIGDLVRTTFADGSEVPLAQAGLMRRYGIDDQYTGDLLLYLARQRRLPDFTLAYFMDNDYASHKVGPREAVGVLEAIDVRLGELFAIYGGVDALLSELCVMITGDHAQSAVDADSAKAIISLNDLLSEFSFAPLGKPWSRERELVVCPNMRMVQIYVQSPDYKAIEKVAAALLADSRLDQVIWRAELTQPGSPGYIVATSDRGRLHFWADAANGTPDADRQARDQWGGRWRWRGELAVVVGYVNDAGVLSFGRYPNAFERIAGALRCSGSGHIWATAHPGAEFRLESSLVHVGGGSHGSLHALDSIVPLVLAGAPPDVALPAATRTVDIVPLCLAVLGLETPYAVGSSHIPVQACAPQ